jgi:hypothetical protein
VGRLTWFSHSKYCNQRGQFILMSASSHASTSAMTLPDRECPRERVHGTDKTQELLQSEVEQENNDAPDQGVPGDIGEYLDIGNEINRDPEDQEPESQAHEVCEMCHH